MKIHKTPLKGLLLIDPIIHSDDRGFFLETYKKDQFFREGITDNFIQDSYSRSKRDVLTGMHFKLKSPQAQLVTLMSGHIFDVCVDLRPDSPTFSKWHGIELIESAPRQIYMEPGFAHGYCVLSDFANIHYKVTELYNPRDEVGLLWNDEDIDIKWPIKNPILSDGSSDYLTWRSLKPILLPKL
jgi:dTDP-4-dehydrorhamnose 3,5-epimerase